MRRSRGFTLIEILVGIAIFGTATVGFFVAAAVSYRVVDRAGEKVQVAFLLEEGAEAIRYLRDIQFTDNIRKQPISYDQCLRFDDATKSFVTTQPGNMLLMHLDESVGATSFANASPSSSAGSCSAGTCPTVGGAGALTPNLGKAPTFAAVKLISVPYTSNLDFTTALTASAWIKTAQNSPTFDIVLFKVNNFSFGYKNLKPTVTLTGVGNEIQSTSPTTIPVDTWTHIAFSYNKAANTVRFYINGDPLAPVSVGGALTSQINQVVFLGSFTFVGGLDEVSLYNQVLSDRAIKSLATNNTPPCDVGLDNFVRTVRFQNVCREDINSASFAKDDIIGTTEVASAGGVCTGTGGATGYVDAQSKYARIDVLWGANNELKESVEMYVTNLFNTP